MPVQMVLLYTRPSVCRIEQKSQRTGPLHLRRCLKIKPSVRISLHRSLVINVEIQPYNIFGVCNLSLGASAAPAQIRDEKTLCFSSLHSD